MLHSVNHMSGHELRVVQEAFDAIISQPWFERNMPYELELGSYLIHCYLNGVRDGRLLYEMGAACSFRRYKASKAA